MRICIDAGHNYDKYDTGAYGNGLREQDITFKIAEILKNLLISKGFEVVMTRNTITDILGTSMNSSINTRVKICNSNNCDYFVSIHCNSHASIASGTEVLVYGRGGQAEKLANEVLKELVNDMGLLNRGVKEQNVGVIRDTKCPAILVETAFINNPKEADLLKNNQYEFAYAIYKGICDFLNMPVKNEEDDYIEGSIEETELETVNDIVWELNNRGIIGNKDLWLEKLENDEDSYWLARKCANYIRQFD